MSDPAFSLQLELDPTTGQLLGLRDPASEVEICRYAPGAELELNGLPLTTRLVAQEAARAEHITTLAARVSAAYGAGYTLQIRRLITRGGQRLHGGRPGSVHLRYEVRRVPHTADGEGLDAIWQPELEAPLHLDTFGALCAPAQWFGAGTRMRAIAIGGSGPRAHVSLEDGPIADVVPHLQTGFRTVFPGQQTITGALYYHPSDERFVWVIVRRPPTGGRLQFGPHRHAHQFYYFTELMNEREVSTPAISFHWGRGLAEADRVLAAQFDLYEEPPPWWYHTSWFWLHPGWQPGGSYAAMGEGVDVLMGEAGVNGFGLFMHDVPISGNDCDINSPQPAPALGGSAALQRVLDRIRAKGGHTYAWMSRHGHRADALGFKESWALQGRDGRPLRIRHRPDAGVGLDILNPADPSYQEYLRGWIEYYVKQLGITGIFWDSGLQPLYPDFGGKPYLKHPGETLAAAQQLYAQLYRYGRSLSPDFFMWAEGISVDYPLNAFAVDNRSHGPASGHALMHRLAHAGPRRLVWRSAWPHDVASGFPFIKPAQDIGQDPTPAFYREIAADPMNRWLCREVQARGVRQARGLADGISLWDQYVVACPGMAGPVALPAALAGGRALQPVLGGAPVSGTPTAAGPVTFTLPAAGAYELV